MKNLILVLGCLSLLLACQAPTATTETETQATEEKPVAKEPETYRALVDNLRLRKEPALKANVVHTLKEGEEVSFLGEKSKHQDKITLRGKSVQAPWYKVKAKTGQVGWAFAGALISSAVDAVEGQTSKRVELPSVELQKLIGLFVDATPETYAGKYSYYLAKDNKQILHGKFKFVGKDWIEDYNIDVVYTYEGQFDQGKKGGLFSRKIDGIEGNSLTRLFFDADKCTWGEWEANAEGEVYENRVDEPRDCEFDAVEKY